MSMLNDMVKGIKSTSGIVLEQKLNSLFYLPAKPELETEMIMAQAKQDRVRTGLHLSAILASDNEFCYREQVLSLFYHMHQGENINVDLMRIFGAGTFIGEKWQRLFIRGELGGPKDMDISRFRPEFDLSYTPDATITLGNKKYICEIKSMNTFQFQKATSHPSGRKQLRMYMFLDKVKHGFVLVEDKNTQKFKVFPEVYGETFTKEDIIPYIDRLKIIQEYKQVFQEEKKMPDRICPNATCKRAMECNMRGACWNIDNGRVKLRKSE